MRKENHWVKLKSTETPLACSINKIFLQGQSIFVLELCPLNMTQLFERWIVFFMHLASATWMDGDLLYQLNSIVQLGSRLPFGKRCHQCFPLGNQSTKMIWNNAKTRAYSLCYIPLFSGKVHTVNNKQDSPAKEKLLILISGMYKF